jgi:hypothetical protein
VRYIVVKTSVDYANYAMGSTELFEQVNVGLMKHRNFHAASPSEYRLENGHALCQSSYFVRGARPRPRPLKSRIATNTTGINILGIQIHGLTQMYIVPTVPQTLSP